MEIWYKINLSLLILFFSAVVIANLGDGDASKAPTFVKLYVAAVIISNFFSWIPYLIISWVWM